MSLGVMGTQASGLQSNEHAGGVRTNGRYRSGTDTTTATTALEISSMTDRISRRDVMKGLGAIGAGGRGNQFTPNYRDVMSAIISKRKSAPGSPSVITIND
jgi:hypothetical protein